MPLPEPVYRRSSRRPRHRGGEEEHNYFRAARRDWHRDQRITVVDGPRATSLRERDQRPLQPRPIVLPALSSSTSSKITSCPPPAAARCGGDVAVARQPRQHELHRLTTMSRHREPIAAGHDEAARRDAVRPALAALSNPNRSARLRPHPVSRDSTGSESSATPSPLASARSPRASRDLDLAHRRVLRPLRFLPRGHAIGAYPTIGAAPCRSITATAVDPDVQRTHHACAPTTQRRARRARSGLAAHRTRDHPSSAATMIHPPPGPSTATASQKSSSICAVAPSAARLADRALFRSISRCELVVEHEQIVARRASRAARPGLRPRSR